MRARTVRICLSLLAVAALVAGAVGASAAFTARDLEARKGRLRALVAEEREALPDRVRALALAMDEVALAAAAEPWPGDLAAPGLETAAGREALFARSMVYARAAVPEIARLDAIAGAVRRSEKDPLTLCLVRPPEGPTPEDLRAAATRYWIGGALFEDATHAVFPLYAVHDGLRPLGRAFAAELDEATDALWVRRLEEEYAYRKPAALSLARLAADSDLLVVVADELPPGVSAPELGKSITATRRPPLLPRIEDAPHAVRAVVWSAERREIVLRVRTSADAARSRTREAAYPTASSAIQGCQVAMAMRGAPGP